MHNKLLTGVKKACGYAVLPLLLLAPGSMPAQQPGETNSGHAEIDSVKNWVANSSFVFVKNMGQFDYAPGGQQVLYKASAKGVDVWVTTGGITYVMSHTQDIMAPRENNIDPGKGPFTRYHRVDMNFVNAQIDPRSIIESDKDETYYNYYTASHPEGILNVPLFRKITVPSIYEGIDWVIYCNGDMGLKFDFVLHPGADPSLIRYTYIGADGIELDKEKNNLLLRTSMGILEEGQLLSYYEEDKAEIRSAFRLDGNTVSVQLPDYDSRKTVVIDPPIVWGTYNGDVNQQGVLDCITDNAGNMFAVGYTNGNIFPQNPGGGAYFQGAITGMCDACIFKFDSWGSKLWATFYGGSATDIGRDIVWIAATNSIVIVGNTGSNNLPFAINAFQGGVVGPNGLGGDGFYVRFNATSCALNTAMYFGGSDDDELRAISTNSTGNTYIVGSTQSINFPVTANAAQLANGGAVGTYDALIMSISPADALLYSSYHGGSGADEGLCIDANVLGVGRVYIAGNTSGGTFPVLNANLLQPAYGGGTSDGFIARYDLVVPVRVWSSFHGGTGNDRVRTMYAYNSHQLYFAEETSSATYPICTPAYNYKGGLDVYFFRLVDINVTPFQDLGEYFGSAANESPWDIAPDANNTLYLVGETNGVNFSPIVATGPVCDYDQAANGGGAGDGFIMKITDCTVQWSTYYGGNGWDWIMGATVSPAACLYIVGEQHSTNLGVPTEIFNPGAGAYFQGASGGAHEQMFTKFCDCPVAYAGPDKSSCCGGVQIGVNPVPCYTYAWTPVTGLSNPNIANPVANPAVTTTYTLTVSAPGCSPTTDVMVFTRITPSCCRLAQADSSAYSVYSVYPNPTRGEVNIQLLDPAGIATIETYDAMGRLIGTKQATGTALITLSLEGRTAGVYFVRIQVEGKVYIERIVKEN